MCPLTLPLACCCPSTLSPAVGLPCPLATLVVAWTPVTSLSDPQALGSLGEGLVFWMENPYSVGTGEERQACNYIWELPGSLGTKGNHPIMEHPLPPRKSQCSSSGRSTCIPPGAYIWETTGEWRGLQGRNHCRSRGSPPISGSHWLSGQAERAHWRSHSLRLQCWSPKDSVLVTGQWRGQLGEPGKWMVS